MTPRANIIWWVVLITLLIALACVVRAHNVTVTWPATGATNRVMLDGVQQAYTAGTNAVLVITNELEPVTVQIIGGGKCYSTRFSIDPVARWTGTQEFAGQPKGPWGPVTLKPGDKLPLTGSGYFRPVITKQLEVVPWWTWATREGRE